jgi:ABC-type branched-subunit amino acid transport system substrate-binding protein
MTYRLEPRPRRLPACLFLVAGLLLILGTGCSPRSSALGTSSAPEGDAGELASGFGSTGVERGRTIYLTGVSPSGRPIRARLTGGGGDVPAELLTCGNCHGRDGVGKAEGGVTPPTITWHELTKAYGPAHPSGRQRPAYDERSVRRAMTMGVDSAGRPLGASMPRYELTHEDLDDLVAFLTRLDSDADPGITDQAVVVGTILAPRESFGGMNRAVREVLAAYFQKLNEQGGIYGRRIQLVCADAPESPQDWAAARRFLHEQAAFALVAPFMAGAEEEIADAARNEGVPVVGPFAPSPPSGAALNRYVFYLHGGLADQAWSLAVFARDRLAGRMPPAVVLFPEADKPAHGRAAEVQGAFERLGWTLPDLVPLSGNSEDRARVRRLKEAKTEIVFVLAPDGHAVEDLCHAADDDWRPLVLMPGPLAGKDVLRLQAETQAGLFLSFPTLPVDITREGAAEYESLGVASQMPAGQRSSQIAALAAAKLFVEAMVASGRAASREKLVEQLEAFSRKPTGLTRPLTFGPNRRFGARGAYVVGIDARQSKFVPASDFIEAPGR